MKKILLVFMATVIATTFALAQSRVLQFYKGDSLILSIPFSSIDSVKVGYSETNVHKYVDLGLPSGLLWATCNLGASKPEESGNYYAWAETSIKSNYSWSTYKYCNGSNFTMTKYCDNSSYGTVDNKTSLELSDDVARASWGGSWRMPTYEEISELHSNCTWLWTTQNGIYGYKVTGPNGNSIFLPAAGRRERENLVNVGTNGYYWSPLLSSSNASCAYSLAFYSSSHHTNFSNRYYGFNVRPVMNIVNDHEYVDLGLPSGLLWATCNLGASKPEEYGDYYAWGETTTKSNYDWSTYKYCNGYNDTMTKYCTSSSYGTVDNKTSLELSDDVARASWGGSWRMPTYEEISELNTKCTWTWTSLNGTDGYKVTGPNGNSIFLPAAGCRNRESLDIAGSFGFYWSSSLFTPGACNSRILYFNSSNLKSDNYGRCFGLSVRPVRE